MLKIAPFHSLKNLQSYYFGELKDRNSAGEWKGRTAHKLRLNLPVRQKEFFCLTDNLHPINGTRLIIHPQQTRCLGFDLAFHGPSTPLWKTLSVGNETATALREIFCLAARDTLERMESDLTGQTTSGNVIWAEFPHSFESAWEDFSPADCHVHCFLFNLTYDVAEIRWRELMADGLIPRARFYEALFHSNLANRLVEWLF